MHNKGSLPGSITADLLRPRLSKSYVDNTKLTDHHAIIPTHKTPPAGLPDKQRNIYQLVAARYLGIFLPAEVRDETTAIIVIAEHSFRARGVVIKEPGWTLLEPQFLEEEKSQKDSSGDSRRLPQLSKAQQVHKRKAELKEGRATAPRPYDDSSLLTAMKNAGQELDDEDLASYMKQSGLGTPATRAAIIERLLQSGYLERSKKALLPTAKGKAIIQQVHEDLKDVGLTAYWEQGLADMQDGKLLLSKFEDGISSFVRNILPDITKGTPSIPAAADTSGFGICPQCKQGIVRKTPKGAGCNRWKEGCTFSIWGEQFGKKLTETQMKELIEKRRTKTLKGFKKKDGTGTYEARLILTDDFKVRLDFEKTTKSK